MVDPRHGRVFFEVLGRGQGIGAVAVHAHAQRLQPLQKQKGVERAHARTQVAQPFDAGLDDESQLAERLREFQIVIAGARFGDLRELAIGPIELAAVDDDAADARAVPAAKAAAGRVFQQMSSMHGRLLRSRVLV